MLQFHRIDRTPTSLAGSSLARARPHESPHAAPTNAAPFDFAAIALRPGGPVIQAKLRVNTPGDRYEREADEVADRVMRMTSAGVGADTQAPGIQRSCSACEDERLQRSGVGPIDTLADAESKVAAVQGGRPPSAEERAFFEPRFGVDFGRVRIHTDAAADAAARSVGALAYTRGRDVVFRSGSFDSRSPTGRRLLAHELAHVVQQGAASPSAASPSAASPSAAIQRTVDEDGKPTAEPQTPARVPAISREQAERAGREALATIGYHGILRRALGAGLLKPSGAPEQHGMQRAPDPGVIQRQDFWTVFSRYAVAAGVASQVDSPAPGPGDLVALGILAVGLYMAATATTTTTTRVCPPCPSPPGPDIDRVPPSTPHWPCPGDHWHYYEYNQNPITCTCYGPRRLFGGCCGLPGAPC